MSPLTLSIVFAAFGIFLVIFGVKLPDKVILDQYLKKEIKISNKKGFVGSQRALYQFDGVVLILFAISIFLGIIPINYLLIVLSVLWLMEIAYNSAVKKKYFTKNK